MQNFIVRAITGVLFVAVIVCSFLKPQAMVVLFALVTGLTIWEFTGLVNDIAGITINRMINTVAGVYFFFAMAGYCSEFTSSAVFIPYLVTLIYLLVAELYLKQEDPIHDWAYTMMSQLYIALPFSLLNVLAFHQAADGPYVVYDAILPLSVFVFLWINDTGAYLWEGSIGGAILVMVVAAIIPMCLELSTLNSPLSTIHWIGLGLTVVIFGTWGDLIESLFKRTIGIKDSGNILPGHGGMLDRFDSSLLAIPAAVVYIYTLLYI